MSSIKQLKSDIDRTIEDAGNLLAQGKQHLENLETKGYTYEPKGPIPRELGQEVIKFILFCRLIDIKKTKLEELKTNINSASIDDPDAQETEVFQNLHESEESKMDEEESTTDAEEEDLEEDWAAEADAEAEKKIAEGIPLFDPKAFAKLVQLDVGNLKIELKSVNIQYEELTKSIEQLKLEFPKNKEQSTQKIIDKETAKRILAQEAGLRPPANIDNSNKKLSGLNEDLVTLKNLRQGKPPQEPTSAAMKYLQKRQLEAPAQQPVSNTPITPSTAPKKRKRDH
ncbi:MAG TPA: hypothetical protein VNK03_02125 [Gammaproteobacteria bacterium]|nr:hypothetical protein [Gammaproteobacteria bacterium]